MIASRSDVLPLAQLWPETRSMSIPQFMGSFNKLVAGAEPKIDVGGPDDQGQASTGR